MTASFSGWRALVLVKNRAILPMRIVKPEMAIASFVVNMNKAIVIGIMRPPPPMPLTLARARKIGITMIPMNSEKYIGKIVLCLQTWLMQMLYGFSGQSSSVLQLVESSLVF